MCHNKAKPEDYKDRTQLVYNAQVSWDSSGGASWHRVTRW